MHSKFSDYVICQYVHLVDFILIILKYIVTLTHYDLAWGKVGGVCERPDAALQL